MYKYGYIYIAFFHKELAYIIMETGKSKSLLWASGLET